MDNDYKLISSNKIIVKWIKLALILSLVVLEILICAQYSVIYRSKGGLAQLIAVIVCCVVLAILEITNTYAVYSVTAKMVFYGFETALLLAICILTGNSYLSALYCIILTQFYLSVDELKSNLILFGISSGLYVISLICGWIIVHMGEPLEGLVIQILGDCLIGIATLAIHCGVTNFILRFYSNNAKLRHALKEADDSKVQLKEVYEQLSNTAVFEERNRIAKDIHDTAGHSMTTVIMQTEAAKLLIDSDPQEAKNRIISANMQAKNALEQMRESVHLLAGRRQTHSLKEEIEEVIAQTIDGTEFKIRYEIDDIQVDEAVFRFIVNSVKECLANGIRHGKATAFYIEIKHIKGKIEILISDNGVGVDGEIKEGFGLKGLKERAEVFGGRCAFASEADEGFEVQISLPNRKAGRI